MSKRSLTDKLTYGAGVGVFVIIFGGIIAIFEAWPVMLVFGILHSFWHGVPAFGFFVVVLFLWALKIVTPYTTKVEDKS